MIPTKKHITLVANNLSIGYNEIVVANNINFELAAGELIGMVGINGIGKSTLLRTLGNIQSKLAGTININSKPLHTLKPQELAKQISVVLTGPTFSKNLRVQELITLGRQPYTNWIGTLTQDDKSKISESIQLLELEHLVQKKCFELSDGQLQQVMIARALAQDTAIILLDEPTTHLDLYHKVQILKLLKSITTKTSKTILFTSHEIEMAIQLCDKMLLLAKDETSFGTPNELIELKAFDSIFPKDTIQFDAKSGSFQIKK